jgi:hypothetical protein
VTGKIEDFARHEKHSRLYRARTAGLRLFRGFPGPLSGRFIDTIRCDRGQQLVGLLFLRKCPLKRVKIGRRLTAMWEE